MIASPRDRDNAPGVTPAGGPGGQTSSESEIGVGVALHSSSKLQKPAKNKIQKIREIDGSYLCLQQFDEFLIQSTFNDQKQKTCKSAKFS